VATIQYGTLNDEFTRIVRRQQDDLPAHVTKDAYFEDHRVDNLNTGYYFDTSSGRTIPVEFIQANDTYLWVQLHRHNDTWITNQGGIIRNNPDLGWWLVIDP